MASLQTHAIKSNILRGSGSGGVGVQKPLISVWDLGLQHNPTGVRIMMLSIRSKELMQEITKNPASMEMIFPYKDPDLIPYSDQRTNFRKTNNFISNEKISPVHIMQEYIFIDPEFGLQILSNSRSTKFWVDIMNKPELVSVFFIGENASNESPYPQNALYVHNGSPYTSYNSMHPIMKLGIWTEFFQYTSEENKFLEIYKLVNDPRTMKEFVRDSYAYPIIRDLIKHEYWRAK